MNPNDLVSQMLAASQAQTGALQRGSGVLNDASARLGDFGTQIQTLGTQAIEAAGEAAKQTAAAEYATNIVHQQAQRAAGLDPDEVNNQIAQSLARVNEAQGQRLALESEWNDLQQVDFMSNPIGYIVNQFKANDVARKHNALAQIENSALSNIAARTDAVKQIKSSVSANTADTLAAARASQAKADTINSQLKLAQAQADVASKQAGIWMQQVDLEFKQAGIAKDFVKFRQDQAQFAETLADRREARAVRAAQMEELRASKKEADLRKQEQQDRLSAIANFVGRTDFSIETVGKMPAPERSAIVNAADTLTLGSDLASSVAFVDKFGNTGNMVTGGNAGAVKLVTGAATSIKSRAAVIGATKDKTTLKTPDAKTALLKAGAEYQDELEKSVSNPKFSKPLNNPAWNTEFNPYRVDHDMMLDTITAGERPELQNNIVTNTIKTLSATRNEPLKAEDENLIFNAIAESVKKGTIKPDAAAAQIKQYYDTAAVQNLLTYQYDRFGLPPAQNYFIQVPISAGPAYTMRVPGLGNLASLPIGSTSVNTPIDLRSTSSIERALRAAAVANTGNLDALRTMLNPALTKTADLLRGYPLETETSK